MKIKNIRFQPLNFSNKKFLLKIADHNTYDKNKQVRSLMPNLIHSLDATSLIILLHNYFDSSNAHNIYAIHDCFASTANNMTKIVELLKISYLSLYGDENYLMKFDKNIRNTIKNQIGDDFDEDQLKISYSLNNKVINITYPDVNEIFRKNYNIELIKKSAYIIN